MLYLIISLASGVGILDFLAHDTERKKSANFEREDGATRHVIGRSYVPAHTANGLDA